MAGEEADREITPRWGDRAALVSARTGLMRRLGGSAEEGGDDPSFFSSKTRAQLCSLQAAAARQKAYARLPKKPPFFPKVAPRSSSTVVGLCPKNLPQLLPGVSGPPGHPASRQDPACSLPPAAPSHGDVSLPFEIIAISPPQKKTRSLAGICQESLLRCVSADALSRL